jgi:hypothetical protein
METHKEISRSCKECGGLLVGRIDQCFCSDACRTSYHNRRKYQERKTQPECIITIQKTLLNNYRILTELRKRGEQFSTLYLQDLGFSFRYLTSAVLQDGGMRCYCFNQCYLLGNQSIILIPETATLEQN